MVSKIAYISCFLLLFTNFCATNKQEIKKNIIKIPSTKVNEDFTYNNITGTTNAWEDFYKGNFKVAATEFENIILSGNTHYDAYYGIANSYFKYYDIEKSLIYLNKTLELRSDHILALLLRSKIYRELKKYNESKNDLGKILSLQKCPHILYGAKGYLTKADFNKYKNEAKTMLREWKL